MSNSANVLANISEEKPRKPGPPPGTPKVAGSGRKPGGRNKRTIDVQQAYGPAARRMAKALEKRFNEEMAKGDAADLDFCHKVWRDCAAYAHGKPTERRELSGPDGGPIERQTQILETSARVSAVFSEVKDTEDVAEQLPDDALRAVQAANFIAAQAASMNGTPSPAHLPPGPAEAGASSRPSQSRTDYIVPDGCPRPPTPRCCSLS